MKLKDFIVCLLLVLAIFLVYELTLHNGFVHFDDDGYVLENLPVRQGLTADSIRFAFTTFHLGNWIPVTWLSYELDVSLWGMSPVSFHRTDLFLHTMNALLMYWFLRRTTGAVWRSAIATALWALHPLRVESVAWIAERKDVLSTFCMLLGILCYERYVTTSRRVWYVALLVMFLLGLMAKSMLVTLPLLLLGLDHWPLNRCVTIAVAGPNAIKGRTHAWRRLVIEKLPLLLISVGFGLVAVLAQRSQSAVVSLELQSLDSRGLHALESYGWYLQKTVLPLNLCAYYPLDSMQHSWGLVALGTVSLVGVGAWAVLQRQAQPWLITGWAWFVIAFLPVIGIVQVGGQAYADRYSYVPSMGLMILVVWELNHWLDFLPRGMGLKVGLTAVSIAFLSLLANLQVGYWFDARSLWTHAIDLNPENWLAQFHLGRLALRENDGDAAIEHFHRALELSPNYVDAHLMIAAVEQHRRNWEAAERQYREVLAIQPDHADATLNLGVIARSTSRFDEAKTLLESCLTRPGFASRAHLELGHLEAEQGRLDEGLAHFDAATQIEPQLEMGYEFAATVCEKLNRPKDAMTRLDSAVLVLPKSIRLRVHLAQLLHADGQVDVAIEQLEQARALKGDDPRLSQLLERLRRSGNEDKAAP